MSSHPHDARNGYGCLTAPDSDIPPVLPDVGHRRFCTCGREWEVSEVAGFLAWRPIEPNDDAVHTAIIELLGDLARCSREDR